MQENNPVESFVWKGVSLYQDERVLKVGTDAILLAQWVTTLSLSPSYILDVGTGSGILTLLMAQSHPHASVLAIDPDENAFQLARLNIHASLDRHRIHVEQKDLLELAVSTDQRFELIISNPPFYMNHVLPSSGVMQSAKHTAAAPERWISLFAQLLNDRGCICLVIPAHMAFEWIKIANECQLFCTQRMEVYSFRGDRQAKRSLLCFQHELLKPKQHNMVMYETNKVYTEEYANWLGI